MCEDISGGQENLHIPATNLVDDPPFAPTGKFYLLFNQLFFFLNILCLTLALVENYAWSGPDVFICLYDLYIFSLSKVYGYIYSNFWIKMKTYFYAEVYYHLSVLYNWRRNKGNFASHSEVEMADLLFHAMPSEFQVLIVLFPFISSTWPLMSWFPCIQMLRSSHNLQSEQYCCPKVIIRVTW